MKIVARCAVCFALADFMRGALLVSDANEPSVVIAACCIQKWLDVALALEGEATIDRVLETMRSQTARPN